MTEPVQYEFYAPWPLFGKKLSNQWGESRQNTEVLAALVQAAGLDLDDPLKHSDLMSWELGQLDFHNRFRFLYDDGDTALKVQRNSGTESVPVWVTVLSFDYESSTVTLSGASTGFYLGNVALFGNNPPEPDFFSNVQTLYFSSDDGFYLTLGPGNNPVVNLSDRVQSGTGGGGLSSVAVRSTVSSPTYNTDTVIFDKDDFYISPSSTGKPIISINADPGSSTPGISSITIKTTKTPPPSFATDTVTFDRDDFYLSSDSSGKPVVSLAAEDVDTNITALTVKTTVPLPTFSTDTLIFDRADFYISPNSVGKPVVSLAAEDVDTDTDTTALTVTTTDLNGAFTPTSFITDKVTFNRRDFYLAPDAQGKPVINLAQQPTTSTGDPTVVSGVQSRTFPSSVEWQFNHNLNARPLLWGIYDPGFKAFLPDHLDISDPNTAYFYFSEASAGTAIVSSGRTSVDITGGFYGISVKDTSNRDHFKNINTLSFNSDDFYINQNFPNTDEAIVNFKSTIPIKSYLMAKFSSDQSTNIAAGDHVKFVTAVRTGSNISLDSTSAYTNGTGASLGRFTLSAGKAYVAHACLEATFSSGIASVEYYWANDNGSTVEIAGGISNIAIQFPNTFSLVNVSSQLIAVAFFVALSTITLEVRFLSATNLTSLAFLNSYATIQEL